MRENWEIRKLGDICTIKNGRGQKAVENPNGRYPIYGSGGIMGYADDYICEAGTTIIGRKGTINKPIFVDCAFWNVDTAFGLQPNTSTNPRFLFLLCKNIDFTRYNKSTTLPSLVKSDLLKIDVQVPPIAEQEMIVAELDCLTGIIEKKKQQLEELDKLAQSIFYEMFGDPESSPFPVKTLGELSRTKLSYGSGASAIPYDGRLRYVRITDIDENGELNNDIVSPSAFDDKYLLHEGDLLFARSGATVGKTYLYRAADGDAIFAGYLIRVVPDTSVVKPKYLFSFTKTGYYQRFISLNAQAVAQPNINAKQYGSLRVVVPPLDLQNEFAKKVEAIEKQKELVKRSIVETETLFNSRMDYWFNN